VARWDPNADQAATTTDVKKDDETLPDIQEHDESDGRPPMSATTSKSDDSGTNRLCFDSFDPIQVIRNGRKLLGSSGNVNCPVIVTLTPRNMTFREISISALQKVSPNRNN
jgi:hypothetical protein